MADIKNHNPEVVTSDDSGEKYKSKKVINLFNIINNKKLVRYIIFGLVALIVLTGLGYFKHMSDLRQTKLKAMSQTVQGILPIQKSQYYSDQGEYALAEKVWAGELAKAKDTQTKISIYFSQSAIATKFKEYPDAKNYANQALALDVKSSVAYSSLAYIAEAQGDTSSAKTYWSKAIANLNASVPGYNLTKYDYQTNLDKLK